MTPDPSPARLHFAEIQPATWHARWIWRAGNRESADVHLHVRRSFQLAAVPARMPAAGVPRQLP